MPNNRGAYAPRSPGGSMVPFELRAVDQGPEEVFQPLTALVAARAAQPGLEVGRLARAGPARGDHEEGALHRRAVVGRLPADARAGVERTLLRLVLHQVAVEDQKRLR